MMIFVCLVIMCMGNAAEQAASPVAPTQMPQVATKIHKTAVFATEKSIKTKTHTITQSVEFHAQKFNEAMTDAKDMVKEVDDKIKHLSIKYRDHLDKYIVEKSNKLNKVIARTPYQGKTSLLNIFKKFNLNAQNEKGVKDTKFKEGIEQYQTSVETSRKQLQSSEGAVEAEKTKQMGVIKSIETENEQALSKDEFTPEHRIKVKEMKYQVKQKQNAAKEDFKSVEHKNRRILKKMRRDMNELLYEVQDFYLKQRKGFDNAIDKLYRLSKEESDAYFDQKSQAKGAKAQ